MSPADPTSAIAHRIVFVAERDTRFIGQILISPNSTLSLPAAGQALACVAARALCPPPVPVSLDAG